MAPRESGKPSALSEEYVVDSSDDQDEAHSEQNSNTNAKAIPETPSKHRRSAKANEPSKRKVANPSAESNSSSESGEEDGRVDGEEDNEDEAEVTDLLDDSAKQASSKPSSGKEWPRKKSKSTPAIKRSIPPKQFNPPPGFVNRSAKASDSASPAAQFLSNDLGGKQIWHITAPPNVSMESIKPFAIRSAMKGEPIMHLQSKWYCLNEGPSTNKCALTPNDTEDAYVLGKATVSRTFHLREIITSRAKDKRSEVSQSKQIHFEFQPHDTVPARPKRKQPEGLRMRYKPFGTTDESAKETIAERSEIYLPHQIPSPSADNPGRKKQKSLQHEESPAAEADSDAIEVDPKQTPSSTQIVSPKSKKSLKTTPSKQVVTEEGSMRQDKAKTKSKKNRDREVAST